MIEMAKTIEEFSKDPVRKVREVGNKKHDFFYLDDYLENNPYDTCPKCNKLGVVLVSSHSGDSYDYRCDKCGFTYSIVPCKRGEDH